MHFKILYVCDRYTKCSYIYCNSTTFMFEIGQSWKTAALKSSKCVCFFYNIYILFFTCFYVLKGVYLYMETVVLVAKLKLKNVEFKITLYYLLTTLYILKVSPSRAISVFSKIARHLGNNSS